MVTHPLQRRAVPRASALVATPAGTVGLLGLLLAASLFVRTSAIDAGFWIDEGVSVGISSFPLQEIPGVLRQDGSPPLYYFLLHVWMGMFGQSETATHALSLVFALAAVPAALWAGWSFGRRAAWIAAALAALNPFLTIYAQETRMYSLVILLSLLGTAAFVRGFVFRDRRYVAVFAVILAVMLYTHYWALFFAAGAAVALVFCARENAERRRLLFDAALAFGAAALAFVPWLPTAAFQAAHTGAPWSAVPSPLGLIGGLSAVLSGQGTLVALLFGAGIGAASLLRRHRTTERLALVATLAIAAGTLVSAWLFSQITPAWAPRYLGVLLGPLLLAAAAGVAHGGRLGLVSLVLVVLFWGGFRPNDEKSNAREAAATFAPWLERGDVVISTQPEQVPVLAYYFPPGLRYVTPLGPVAEPRVMDWRDALSRLEASSVETTLEPVLRELPKGTQVVLVRPFVRDPDAWTAPWTELVRLRSFQWFAALRRDERFTRTAHTEPAYTDNVPRALRVDVYRKTRSG